MTDFLRLLAEPDKAGALLQACTHLRQGENEARHFELAPNAFDAVPGKPFAYWVSEAIRGSFNRFSPFESDGRTAKVGLATADDFRFLRSWWEIADHKVFAYRDWPSFAKGGSFSQYYADISLVLNWKRTGAELKESVIAQHGNAGKRVYNEEYYFRPAITWPLRAHRFSPQALPAECIFSVRGYTAYSQSGSELATLAMLGSSSFDYIFKTALGRFGYPEFIVGILQLLPWAAPSKSVELELAPLAKKAWSLKRLLDTVNEDSHAFMLPAELRTRLGNYDPSTIEAELANIQAEIDAHAFDLYGFAEADRQAANGAAAESSDTDADDEESEAPEVALPSTDGMLSWAIGVAFGRFDWRLATGERAAPPEPEPFDPLPTQSPGMLPDGARPFHAHSGILVDDPGHAHDLAHLVEEVLARVAMPVPDDVRRWLQRDFFAFHLQRYSKSRRKAPIHWPLATASGSYTLWLHYPRLDSQTLYTAINDFIEPRLKQVGSNLATLRTKGPARSRDDEKRFETLQTLEAELSELRDTLLKIAPHYHPNHDDGVQITAAPLWPLFRHKPWQKILKDTWAKLENGDYDWAHLAMNYWPERVREKCKTDKSLAIAHGLETLYVEPEAKAKKTRVKKKSEGEI